MCIQFEITYYFGTLRFAGSVQCSDAGSFLKSVKIRKVIYQEVLPTKPLEAGIYRWSIILADTDFFQQSESIASSNH